MHQAASRSRSALLKVTPARHSGICFPYGNSNEAQTTVAANGQAPSSGIDNQIRRPGRTVFSESTCPPPSRQVNEHGRAPVELHRHPLVDRQALSPAPLLLDLCARHPTGRLPGLDLGRRIGGAVCVAVPRARRFRVPKAAIRSRSASTKYRPARDPVMPPSLGPHATPRRPLRPIEAESLGRSPTSRHAAPATGPSVTAPERRSATGRRAWPGSRRAPPPHPCGPSIARPGAAARRSRPGWDGLRRSQLV